MTKQDILKYFNDINEAYNNPNKHDDLSKMLDMLAQQEPCEDAISRQAVLDGLASIAKAKARSDAQKSLMGRVVFFTEHLPPVTPQPKTGHWEWVQYDYNPKLGNWHCSECRCVFLEFVEKNEKSNIPLYKYCPQCGAKMIEPQDSEDKE